MTKHICAQPRTTNFALERAMARLPACAAPSRALVTSLLRGSPEVEAEVSRLRSAPDQRSLAATDRDFDHCASRSRRPEPPESDGPDAAEACIPGARPNGPPGGACASVPRDEQLTASALSDALEAAARSGTPSEDDCAAASVEAQRPAFVSRSIHTI